MATVTIRYIVDDIDAAVDFYRRHLGFDEVMRPAPTFALLARGDLRLALSAPGAGPGGGGRPMPDGTLPRPGGWNRFLVEVPDLEGMVGELEAAGVPMRSGIITGVGGTQVLVDDPAGIPSNCSSRRAPRRTRRHRRTPASRRPAPRSFTLTGNVPVPRRTP